MLEQGKFIKLGIVKRSTFGLFLGDEDGEEVLLPNKYCTDSMKPGLDVEVFIYRDSEDRKVATTLKSFSKLNRPENTCRSHRVAIPGSPASRRWLPSWPGWANRRIPVRGNDPPVRRHPLLPGWARLRFDGAHSGVRPGAA